MKDNLWALTEELGGEEGTRTTMFFNTEAEAIGAQADYVSNNNTYPTFICEWDDNGPIEDDGMSNEGTDMTNEEIDKRRLEIAEEIREIDKRRLEIAERLGRLNDVNPYRIVIEWTDEDEDGEIFVLPTEVNATRIRVTLWSGDAPKWLADFSIGHKMVMRTMVKLFAGKHHWRIEDMTL